MAVLLLGKVERGSLVTMLEPMGKLVMAPGHLVFAMMHDMIVGEGIKNNQHSWY